MGTSDCTRGQHPCTVVQGSTVHWFCLQTHQETEAQRHISQTRNLRLREVSDLPTVWVGGEGPGGMLRPSDCRVHGPVVGLGFNSEALGVRPKYCEGPSTIWMIKNGQASVEIRATTGGALSLCQAVVTI